MKELLILLYQARQIEDTFRKIEMTYKVSELDSALGRDFTRSWGLIKSVLSETPYDVTRCNCEHCKQVED
jgi:hypothetical protein